MQAIPSFRPLRLAGLAVAAVLLGLLGPRGVAAAEDSRKAVKDLRAKYVAEVRELAGWCEQEGLEAEARKTREVLGRRDPFHFYLPKLPVEVGPPPPPENASEKILQWHERLGKLRRDQAIALFEQGRKAIRNHQASLAYELVLAAIRENPDHEGARRVLGYQKYFGQWHTPYEIRKLRANLIWHDQYGWISKGAVRKYEQGLRPSGNRWIDAEEDAKLHRDIRSGWEIETEHYDIRTNHSLEEGVALGMKLETLYRLWQQLFVRYYASESQVAALFENRPVTQRPDPPRFAVVYFPDKEDYFRSLKAVMPQMGKSVGVYVAKNQTAYFYAGSEYTERTIYHEATHQLFQQSRKVPDNVGRKTNFWICEGIALFMETLHEDDGYYVLGGLGDQRINAARYHLTKGDFYVPFARMTRYGVETLQTDPQVGPLYSQMAAMTSFLIYYDGGRYRDSLVEYLSKVYTARDTAALLSELTGTSYDDLDKQYQEFMEIGRR
jgi:hypothetical protein